MAAFDWHLRVPCPPVGGREVPVVYIKYLLHYDTCQRPYKCPVTFTQREIQFSRAPNFRTCGHCDDRPQSDHRRNECKVSGVWTQQLLFTYPSCCRWRVSATDIDIETVCVCVSAADLDRFGLGSCKTEASSSG